MAAEGRLGTLLGYTFLGMAAVIMLQPGAPLRSRIDGWRSARASKQAVDRLLAQLITAENPLGAGDSLVVVEFTDFRCGFCRSFHDSLPGLHRIAPTAFVAVRLAPRPGDPLAYAAASASVCASAQGRFEQYADLLFATDDWEREKNWVPMAARAGITDTSAFAACLGSGIPRAILTRDSALAATVGVRGTPAFASRGTGLHIGLLPNADLAKRLVAVAER